MTSASRHRRLVAALTCAMALAAALGGCARDVQASAPGPIAVWVHSGTPAERATVTDQVNRFNAAHPTTPARLRVVTEGNYQDTLQAAVASATLPDVLEVDGPMLASMDHQSALADLGALLPGSTVTAMLPSLRAQGTVGGRLVGAGSFDSGLGIYGNRRLLDAAGVHYPAGVDDSWSAAQLTAAMTALAKRDPDHRVLDTKLNYGTGAWLTYGMAPLLWSASADLTDRSTGRATGTLDGPAGVRALTQLQDWQGFTDPDADDRAFTSGRVALSWVGHWVYPGYAKALGKDLVVLPLPDLGRGTKTGQGSYAWSVTAAGAKNPVSGEFLSFLLSAPEVTRTTDANGAVPGRTDVLAASRLYGPGGALERFGHQLARTCGSGPISTSCVATSRPVTPAFPVISDSFSRAVATVLDGGDVQRALTQAATEIDADLAASDGYARRP